MPDFHPQELALPGSTPIAVALPQPPPGPTHQPTSTLVAPASPRCSPAQKGPGLGAQGKAKAEARKTRREGTDKGRPVRLGGGVWTLDLTLGRSGFKAE